MASRCAILLLVLITLSTALGLAGLIVGAVGDSWWTYDYSDFGLWKSKITFPIEDKSTRSDILHFDKNVSKDVILILIIIGGGFAFLSLLCSILICCCVKKTCLWTIGRLFLISFTFFAGCCGLAGVIFAEIVFKGDWEYFRHGYAAILAWIGSGSCLVSCVLSCVTFFINEK